MNHSHRYVRKYIYYKQDDVRLAIAHQIPHQIKSRAEEQFKVGIKATLILYSRLCGSLRSPRDVVYSAMRSMPYMARAVWV